MHRAQSLDCLNFPTSFGWFSILFGRFLPVSSTLRFSSIDTNSTCYVPGSVVPTVCQGLRIFVSKVHRHLGNNVVLTQGTQRRSHLWPPGLRNPAVSPCRGWQGALVSETPRKLWLHNPWGGISWREAGVCLKVRHLEGRDLKERFWVFMCVVVTHGSRAPVAKPVTAG